jgi:cobalamin synthase
MDGTLPYARRNASGGLFGRGLVQVAGWIAAGCAVVVAAVLALIFTASLVVIAVMASALIAFTGFAMRARRTARVPTGQYLSARKVGHSWVAYGFDRR